MYVIIINAQRSHLGTDTVLINNGLTTTSRSEQHRQVLDSVLMRTLLVREATSLAAAAWLAADDVGQSSNRLIVSKWPPFAASISIVDPSCITVQHKHTTKHHIA